MSRVLTRAALTTKRPPAALMVLGSCVSLQVGAALAARLFPVFGNTTVTLLRLAGAAAVLLVITRPTLHRWTGRQWRAIAAFGVTLAGMNGFFYAGLERVPLGAAVTIEFLGPLVLAAVLSRRPRDLVWVALALAGIALFGLDRGGATDLDVLGVVLVLIAGAFWALYILASARVGSLVPGSGGLAVAVAVAALLVVPLGASGAGELAHRPALVLPALVMALFASVIPYSLELAALRRLPQHVFGILMSLEPVVATAAGWLLLEQGIGVIQCVAVLFVVTASAGSTLSARLSASPPLVVG